MIGLGVSKINFRDNTSEALPETGIVVIVGPNNSGKSVLLREINDELVGRRSHIGPKWIANIEVARAGSEEDFREWFNRFGRVAPEGDSERGAVAYWQQGGRTVTIDDAVGRWTSDRSLPNLLMPKLVAYLPALSRDGLLGSPGVRDQMVPAAHPVHQMWDDRELEQRLSNFVNHAFGFPVSINRYTQNVEILSGNTGMQDEPLPASRALLEAYAKLLPLHQQGDGVKSFVGLLLHSIISGTLITLIDEPEAFLHPPQARLLGRHLAQESPKEGQVIIATHSNDVLEGILDGSVDREIKVIRVSQPQTTQTRQWRTLDPERVSQLWKDPLLRYSRLLDGLFHKGVVICEADNDCRFYAAVLDSYLDGRFEHDLVFTHVGGKGRLARAAAELTRFGVPVAVVGDIDVLQEHGQVERLIEAVGGSSRELVDDLRILREQVQSRSSSPLVSHLKNVTDSVLRRSSQSRISDDEAAAIVTAIKVRSGWKEVKRAGLASFDGHAARAADEVMERLALAGIFLVPVGELERWYPTLNAGHGMAYVTAVLEGGHHKTLTPPLKSFLEKLSSHFDIRSVASGAAGIS